MGCPVPVHCRCCNEPLDVYQEFEHRFCSEDCETTEAEYQANVNNGSIEKAREMTRADWPEKKPAA